MNTYPRHAVWLGYNKLTGMSKSPPISYDHSPALRISRPKSRHPQWH